MTKTILDLGWACLISVALLAACSSDSDAGPVSSSSSSGGGANAGGGGAGGSGTTGGGGGQSASCSPSDPCESSQYCGYSDGLCGEGQPTGTCYARPQTDCGPPGPAVCGCDGQVYLDGYCGAQLNGIDVALADRCSAPDGT